MQVLRNCPGFVNWMTKNQTVGFRLLYDLRGFMFWVTRNHNIGVRLCLSEVLCSINQETDLLCCGTAVVQCDLFACLKLVPEVFEVMLLPDETGSTRDT